MKNKTKTAAFSLEDYSFIEVYLNISKTTTEKSSTIDLDFIPSGEFSRKENKYILYIEFLAFDEKYDKKEAFIKTKLVANFKFKEVNNIEDIPTYFYRNSIAIVFPYIRAFVSNLSLQANAGSLILPTLNLGMLEDTLKKNTTSI